MNFKRCALYSDQAPRPPPFLGEQTTVGPPPLVHPREWPMSKSSPFGPCALAVSAWSGDGFYGRPPLFCGLRLASAVFRRYASFQWAAGLWIRVLLIAHLFPAAGMASVSACFYGLFFGRIFSANGGSLPFILPLQGHFRPILGILSCTNSINGLSDSLSPRAPLTPSVLVLLSVSAFLPDGGGPTLSTGLRPL